MVCLGERERDVLKSSMAATPERTSAKPLHNFGLPWLRWGSQRYLRCMKLDSDAADSRSAGFGLDAAAPIARRTESERRKRKLGLHASPIEIETTEEEEENEQGIAAVREKLLIDLKEAVAKIKDAILGDEAADVASAEEARPWNLRTRRAACRAPQAAPESPVPAKSRPVREVPPAAKKKEEPVNFAVSLSREEIEADFRAVLGHRPPRRPKKRARAVQRNLDSLFPGLLLGEITAERYKVSEIPES